MNLVVFTYAVKWIGPLERCPQTRPKAMAEIENLDRTGGIEFRSSISILKKMLVFFRCVPMIQHPAATS